MLLMSRLVSHPSTTNHPTCNHSAPLEEGKKEKKKGGGVITIINTYFSYTSILLKKKLKKGKCPCLFYITLQFKKFFCIIHLFSQSNIM